MKKLIKPYCLLCIFYLLKDDFADLAIVFHFIRGKQVDYLQLFCFGAQNIYVIHIDTWRIILIYSKVFLNMLRDAFFKCFLI